MRTTAPFSGTTIFKRTRDLFFTVGTHNLTKAEQLKTEKKPTSFFYFLHLFHIASQLSHSPCLSSPPLFNYHLFQLHFPSSHPLLQSLSLCLCFYPLPLFSLTLHPIFVLSVTHCISIQFSTFSLKECNLFLSVCSYLSFSHSIILSIHLISVLLSCFYFIHSVSPHLVSPSLSISMWRIRIWNPPTHVLSSSLSPFSVLCAACQRPTGHRDTAAVQKPTLTTQHRIWKCSFYSVLPSHVIIPIVHLRFETDQHCNPVWCDFNQRSDLWSVLGAHSCWIRETECDQEPRKQSVSRHGSESRCQSCFSFLSLLGLFCTCQNIHSFVLHTVNHITAPQTKLYTEHKTQSCVWVHV